jgi:hypothetical protein
VTGYYALYCETCAEWCLPCLATEAGELLYPNLNGMECCGFVEYGRYCSGCGRYVSMPVHMRGLESFHEKHRGHQLTERDSDEMPLATPAVRLYPK